MTAEIVHLNRQPRPAPEARTRQHDALIEKLTDILCNMADVQHVADYPGGMDGLIRDTGRFLRDAVEANRHPSD